MKTVDKHFETIIVTSMIAKQEVIIQCLDGEIVKGFIHPSIDPEGFQLVNIMSVGIRSTVLN